ncbi:MAG: hypothetical protein JNK15_10800 [Planctomycetes bacterium]|nr:hypothetical protein [Planctomycetota bacterium]
MTRSPLLRSFLPLCLPAVAVAQIPQFALTFSQPETTASGSGGTVLQNLRPNEIVTYDWLAGPCATVSAEKFVPRTCFHTMAGDENGDGLYWNPALFGTIDALCGRQLPAVAGTQNARTLFWSPSAAMGTTVSALPLRPGDVGHIVNLPGDGQVEYFMRQEQFNQALGLAPATPIDVDAIAFSPNYGVLFSLDADIAATTVCGPTFVRDGDILCVPGWAVTWTPDLRVGAVMPNSAAVVFTEAQIDALVVNAGVTDRFGACIPNAVDLESIEIDWSAPPPPPAFPCGGIAIPRPHLIFATETMTGGSLLTTVGGGTIYAGPCGPVGTPCPGGPTWGPQIGIRPASTTTGAASFVNAITDARVCRYVLEPQQHVLPYFGAGGPPTTIDVGSPFLWNFVFIEIAPPVVPVSLTVAPAFSALCFPDLYTPSLTFWGAAPAPFGFGSIATPAIPPLWSGKLLFQSLAFGGSGLELSTPTVIDVQ